MQKNVSTGHMWRSNPEFIPGESGDAEGAWQIPESGDHANGGGGLRIDGGNQKPTAGSGDDCPANLEESVLML